MTDSPSQIPQTAENLIPKSEIMAAITAASFEPDILIALQNWLAEQPGDSVPQEAFMLELAELAEIENHLATSISEMADEVQAVAAESQRLDDQAGIAELQIQRDGLAQMQQYAAVAEQLVASADPQPQPQSQPPASVPPMQVPQVTPDVTA